jgi:hypothetical protein
MPLGFLWGWMSKHDAIGFFVRGRIGEHVMLGIDVVRRTDAKYVLIRMLN